MSAAIHKDRIGYDKKDVTGLDKQLIYMTRLSREVGLACDSYFIRKGMRRLDLKGNQINTVKKDES